jgi:ABC-2 type transport system permease protein
MSALSIAFKDLQIFFKDRGLVFQLFLLPLFFIMIFSGALAELGSDEGDGRIVLAVVDLDRGELAHVLIDNLDAAGGVRTQLYERSEAESQLAENEIPRMLTIPAGFSDGIGEGNSVTLSLVFHEDADSTETEAVRLVVEGVAQDMSLETQILAALQQVGVMQADVSAEEQSFAIDRIVAQARSQFERAESQPLIAAIERIPSQDEGTEANPELDQTAVPAFTVLFVFLGSQATARSIYDEKRTGSFRRLLAAPMSKTSLLIGKMLPTFLMALIQTAVIFTFGVLVLNWLGMTAVPIEKNPLGVVVVALAIALCSSALGLVIAAIARTENQIGGVSTLILWGMGLIGGSIAPLFILERFFGSLPKIVPHYWANHAFQDLLVRDLPMSEIGLEIAALLGFTALFFLIGLWRFDFD